VSATDSFTTPVDPPLALSRHAHDRFGSQRVDEEWLERQWASGEARVTLLHGGRVAINEHGDPLYVATADTGPGERILLGVEAGTTYFAVLLEDEPGQRMAGLREIATGLGDRDAGLVVHAFGMANWRHTHRFCPRCGGTLHPANGGHVLRCDRCGRDSFPRTDPAVIMLVTDDADRCLLGHAARSPRSRGFSTLAGFVEPGESLEHAVIREVAEEVGIRVDRVRYFGSQPWPLPASLMVGFYAHAVDTDIAIDAEEITAARWFTHAELLDATESGAVLLPGHISIARRLIEQWYGGPLRGTW
jgi:NAD+ diphosphatase